MPRSATQPSDAGEPLGPLPQEFAALIRPELPSLIQEIGIEVTRAYPEYARLLNGPYGQAIRRGVEQNISAFVDQVASPSAPTTLRDEMCRRFGRFEAYEGRSLETLQGAYRLGARVALRRAKKVGRRYHLSPTLMLSFADALFAYIDELEALTREGYLQVRAEAVEQPDALRRRLLHLILAAPPAPRTAVTELAEQTGWPLPDRVTLVALRSPAGAPRAKVDNDVLLDPADPQPHLLFPGEVDDARRRMLEAAFPAARAAVGLTVPTASAADSLRWARRVLELIDTGVIEDAPLTFCADHLLTLWLLADPGLVDQLAERQLAPLAGLTPTRRNRLVETLRTWLETRGTAAQMGELLDVHPQTVRYRMRTLEARFGGRLTAPRTRFATEAVLRALDLRAEAGRRGER
ncbi:PucR family transcriptional regulator [Streptomyces sp. WAC05374]|uniref:PucR family transcriptional regulator n=1 Tax=Streptomyces sp. WAC05374 TaxID=2487420 RepID=UPI000F88236C|nr:PucR family transcriptional regulator [Streptomyces sp. WAC05374]RST12501.1 PucR family transcriptional regulator [Streptomyces sp. WAC05374]TDF45965.1 PucR family transcriptional regulator [Streptomyces sp. WAC05374]TDF52959.1 PucR family transcriptional regulator [Streptomyces sp. WAC05374]TDF58173.1 PucR family transcriptional regulator [Streptomyces sp. WAC05374]